MKRSKVQWITSALLVSALLGSPGAAAAAPGESLFPEALHAADGRPMLEVTTPAGDGSLGSEGGAGRSATFRIPAGLAVRPDGTVLISDSRNGLIRTWKSGQVGTGAGLVYKLDAKGYPVGGLLDGAADLSLFQEPQGLASDAEGNVYVADAGNNAIRKIDRAGKVTTLAGSGVIGFSDGPGREATFHHPSDVAVTSDGTVYVADTLNHAIRRIAPDGTVKTLSAPSTRVVEAMPGQAVPAGDYADGRLSSAKFNEPSGLALDARGNLFVSDSGNGRIRYVDLERGTVTTAAGSGTAAERKELYVPGGYSDGSALEAKLNYPLGIAVTGEGGLLIADSQNHAIRYLLGGRMTTLAGGAAGSPGRADGTERGARLDRPADVAVLADGTVLVADSFNNELRELRPYRLPAELPKDDGLKVVLDHTVIPFDTEPEIAAGRTMVPVRAITEALGYAVTFDEAARSVRLSKENVSIELYVGRTGVKRYVNGTAGVEKETDAAPYIKDGRTYVPIRFFAEQIGLEVEWSEADRTAVLRSGANGLRP